ncbi:MAG: EAL domain-containing protein [Sphingomonas sp.]|uniref:putative bifunctional diguanylate cyclase/phosphodiesterase n=1 Tax=Sphingomonas sp. TaxID=28214 RepID=UPI0025F3E97B|nr:EAL domain-containing protein [Sphingomonas sp.]MBX9882896.1 EAL domain-containing protein [Sphingomonas sp.]
MGVLTPDAFEHALGDTPQRRLDRLERRLARERAARLEAEAIAEAGLRRAYLAQQRIELLQRVAAKANEAADTGEALRFAVREICDATGWVFGNVYLVDPQAPHRLIPADAWHADDPDALAPFIEASLARGFARGEGLPGRVLASGAPLWLADLQADGNFPRRPVATAVGLASAFAFPIQVQRDVTGVIEFFARSQLAEDADMLAAMGQIGTQLGRVIERERFAAQLLHDALHDPLTALPNRALFQDRVSQALDRRARRGGGEVAVLFLDLDGFKLVNDSFGHHAGDSLLQAIAARLRSVLDALPQAEGWPAWTLARLGGDEFTIVLDEFDQPGRASAVAERLLAALGGPYRVAGGEVHATASIGVALAQSQGVTATDLLRKADTALYEAKARGRGQVALFDKALRKRAMARLQTENDLRCALARDEFRLLYQPIVDMKSNRVSGFEALLRWRRGGGEVVGPGQFIGVAEETGLIVAIGNWVLREACAAAATWNRTHPAPPVSMSINVSPRQFLLPGFTEIVHQTLRETGVPPALVTLEITESIAIANPDRAIEIMRDLRGLGVKIGLDDFGTGYSSLGHLHRYPFSTLKLDRSFVQDLCDPRNRTSPGIVRAVLDLAQTMKLSVVAEGIETSCQRRQLRELGCQFAQGFLYAEPLTPEAASALIARHR